MKAALRTLQQAEALATPGVDSHVLSDADGQDGEADVADGELDPEEQERQVRASRIEHFDELSRRVDSERVDGVWRHQTEGPLKRLLSEHLGPGVTVSEATCAGTLCRVKLSHPEFPRIPPGLMFEFDLARASLDVTEVQHDNRDERATTLYFKRGPAPASQTAAGEN